MAEATHGLAQDGHGHHSNTVRLLGREITVEGGIYTVVFAGLAILTAIEVLSAEFLKGAIHDIRRTPPPLCKRSKRYCCCRLQ